MSFSLGQGLWLWEALGRTHCHCFQLHFPCPLRLREAAGHLCGQGRKLGGDGLLSPRVKSPPWGKEAQCFPSTQREALGSEVRKVGSVVSCSFMEHLPVR